MRHGGRAAGTLNKITHDLQVMILQALDELGGVQWMVELGRNPQTMGHFAALLRAVMPKEIKAQVVQYQAPELPLAIQRLSLEQLQQLDEIGKCIEEQQEQDEIADGE